MTDSLRGMLKARRQLTSFIIEAPTRVAVFFCALILSACTSLPSSTAPREHFPPIGIDQSQAFPLLNRLTWGANDRDWRMIESTGAERYVATQLASGPGHLPAPVQAQIDSLTISRRPMPDIAKDMERQRKQMDAIQGVDEKKAAQRAYQAALGELGREAAVRSVLRDIYSPNQLFEQMSWFWLNHFNVYLYKGPLRAMVGDYEENAIRPHAMGKFRDLLAATVHHPAMLIYLDNQQNAAGHINENYARELMELHTLGVNGGYTQSDVQELARVLTGVGVNLQDNNPQIRPQLSSQYVRKGLFEFNPQRHDYGDKHFLGRTIRGRGLAELDEVLDIISRHPSTARFISRKLAWYFTGAEPSADLLSHMTARFQKTDGDIAAVLHGLFSHRDFKASLGKEFKDPMHYALSAARLACGDNTSALPRTVMGWLDRMGQGLYQRGTPDGYSLKPEDWSSPGQMSARIDIAGGVAYGGSGCVMKTERGQVWHASAGAPAGDFDGVLHQSLKPNTLSTMQQAGSTEEWNKLLLVSPEFMMR